MKNIVLVDRIDFMITHILDNTDWHICVLIVQDEECKKKYIGNSRISEIYTATEFYYLDASSYIDYDDIEENQSAFRMIDSGMNRQRVDYQYTRYNFYMGIALWQRIFSDYSVDMCLLTEIMHGITYDKLMFSVARALDIPCYDIYKCSLTNWVIYSQEKNDLLVIEKNTNDNENVILSDVYYYQDLVHDLDNKPSNNMKQWVGKFLYQLGGNALVQTVLCMKNRSTNFVWYPGMKETKNIFQYLIRFFEMKYIFRLNDKLSVKANYNQNYVVYFLHLEPEAGLTHYATVMDSQLIAIKMISTSLPKDWKLYVKEHPASRLFNKSGWGHFIEFIPKYGSKWFYDMIRGTENVELINVKESASELIKNSRACATVSGTITKECIVEGKPCLLFGDATKNIFSKEKDFFTIRSSKDCKNALEKIEKGFLPEYKSINSISAKYSISTGGTYLDTIMETINKDFLRYNSHENTK